MKDVIILIKLETKEPFYIPFGLLYLANALKKEGFKVKIFHLNGYKVKNLRRIIQDIKPLFVGFSTLTSPSLLPTIEASKIVKSLKLPVVWGGIHPTILPDVCLSEDYIDFIVIGEGEEVIVNLAKCLQNNEKNFEKITGLGYKINGEIKINPPHNFINDLDKYNPEWEMIDLKKYYSKKYGLRKLPLITSRGCPYNCGFCYNSFVNKRKWRYHSENFIEDQITYLKKKHQLEIVYFHDDNFFTNKHRAKRIIERINIPWLGEARADIIDENFVNFLKESKCKYMFIGAESGTERILKLINKGLTINDIRESVDKLKEIDLDVDLSFIIGFPTEEREEIENTLKFIDELLILNKRANATVKIYNPYPGTPLWELSVKCGFKPPLTNKEWAYITREHSNLPWLNNKEAETICNVSLYACKQSPVLYHKGHSLLYYLEKFRWKNRFFYLPLEFRIINFLRKWKFQ